MEITLTDIESIAKIELADHDWRYMEYKIEPTKLSLWN